MKKEKEKKKKSDLVIAIVIIGVAIAVVVTLAWKVLGLFNRGGNKTTQENAKISEIDKIMSRNLDQRYPETPNAVVKLYCSITKELHAKEVTEEQIDKLFNQLRKLFDEELLANNDYEKHLKELKKEIKGYKSKNMVITKYEVEDADRIKTYMDKEGQDCTKVKVTYSLKITPTSKKRSSEWLKNNEEVVLRKDTDGCWKILGYQQTDVGVNDEEE